MKTITNDEVAEFVSGSEENSEAFADLTRRVLLSALREPDKEEILYFLRGVEVTWEQSMANRDGTSSGAQAAPAEEVVALQQSLRRATQAAVGFSNAQELNEAPQNFADTAVQEASELRQSGGGRWITQAARDALEAVLQSVRGGAAKPLMLGRPHALHLPCFAPALAASPAQNAPGIVKKETITTADGVRIEFQQLPGSANRLRVFVDTSLLPAPSPEAPTEAAVYNVAFLTLMEGAENAAALDASSSPLLNRHVLVVALNERGVGYADFAVGDGATGPGKNALPVPRTGGCSLVSATLSYLPPLSSAG